MNLNSILTNKLEGWATVGFIKSKQFNVKLAYLSNDEVLKLRQKCVINNYDPITRQVKEELDDSLFATVFAKSVILDWKGLTVRDFIDFLPIKDGLDDAELSAEVEYSEENAATLLKHSREFDNWVFGVINSVQSFRSSTRAVL